MDLSKIFSFLSLLKESFRLLSKNGMLFASIAILSMILPSILLLSFICFYQSLTDYVKASIGSDSGSDEYKSLLIYLAILLLVEIFFLIIYFAISRISGIATILVSSASYTGNSLSPKLYSSIKRTWRKPLSAGFRSGHNSYTRYLSIFIILAVLLVFMYPNGFTISITVVIVTMVIVFKLYSSVVAVLSLVIIVLDDSTSPGEAMEKSGNLIKGNHLKGFTLNLFMNLLGLMVLGLVWMLSYEGSMNLTVDALIFVNLISIMNEVIFMAYTVLYFQCKKEHGEDIDVVANTDYAILPTTVV